MTKRGVKTATPDEVERAKAMMAKGKTAAEVGRDLGRNRSTINRWAGDWNAALRKAGGKGDKKPAVEPDAAASAGGAREPSEPPLAPPTVSSLPVERTPLPKIGGDTGEGDEPYFCGNCRVVLDHTERPARCPTCNAVLHWGQVK